MANTSGLPPLDNTVGALFVGVLLAMGLYGASSVQVYYYFNRYAKDENWIKALVVTVWILDTAHQALITHVVYTYLVTEYCNAEFLGEIVPTLMIEVPVSGLIIALVQAFFILRIFKLSHHNYLICGFIVSVILANFICQVIYTSRALTLHTFVRLRTLDTLSKMVNILSAVSDILIAASIIYYLQKSRTGFKRSDSVINRLIFFSLNTGLLTSVDAIASLITISIFPKNVIYICFFLTCSRLYSNSLMATLNSRNTSLGLGDDDDEILPKALSPCRFRNRGANTDRHTGGVVWTQPSVTFTSVVVNTETGMTNDIQDDKDTPSISDDNIDRFDTTYAPRNL